jgi:hypothetical protein
MRRGPTLFAVLAILVASSMGRAATQADPSALLSAVEGGDAASLAVGLRALLVTFLPSPLYEDHKHWGGQKLAPDGVHWKGQGLHVHPETQYALKNDGLWQRVEVRAPLLTKSLAVEVRDVERPPDGRLLFTTTLAFDAEAEYERQRWAEGRRLWSSSVMARMHVVLTLRCEAGTRFEPNGTVLPDAVFRLRVLSSNLRYEKLEVTHVAGVGGDAAKLLGEAALAAVRQLHPSLERRLVARADAALVRAGAVKEVRLSLGGLLNKLGR